jgi:hypothetical protein
VKVIRDDDDDDFFFFCFVCLVLFWDFCRATREDSILFAGSSDRETPFETIPGDRDCEKNSQIGRLLKKPN